MVKKISTLAYKSTTLGCKIVATLHRIRNSNTLIKIKNLFIRSVSLIIADFLSWQCNKMCALFLLLLSILDGPIRPSFFTSWAKVPHLSSNNKCTSSYCTVWWHNWFCNTICISFPLKFDILGRIKQLKTIAKIKIYVVLLIFL